MAAWLPLVRLVTLLPQRLDGQLREDAGIGHVYYQILAMLSQAPDEHLRMSELAGLTAISPSRLSHAVAALEDRDRKSVVQGKSVDLGGRRIIKTNTDK